MCFMCVHSFPLILGCFALFFFLSCICYKLLIIRLMKAASTDGPSGLLAACPTFNIEMLYCKFVFFFGGGQIKCLLDHAKSKYVAVQLISHSFLRHLFHEYLSAYLFFFLPDVDIIRT